MSGISISDSTLLTLVQRVTDLADMIAIGLDLPAETFRQAGRYGFAIFSSIRWH